MLNELLEINWPKDGIYARCFVHEIMNYRFHWHADLYEINILLEGSQEHCRNSEPRILKPDDVVVVNPGVGHASLGRLPGTTSLVLQFSPLALKQFLPKGEMFDFSACRSDDATRGSEFYRLLRRYAAMVYLNLTSGSPYGATAARAAMLLLLSTLCEYLQPKQIPAIPEEEEAQRITSVMLRYLEEHYREKVSLQELADCIQYNRTYVSTLFKNTVGMNFHDYLTRIRFQHALIELAITDHNLTDVAMDNGFCDLKSMNATFREILCRSPAQYRSELSPSMVVFGDEVGKESHRFVDPANAALRRRLAEYL